MNKKNLFNIGEVSSALGVTPRMLRHYEEKGVITPHYTDTKTGYRYYDAYNLQDILLVLLLKDAGIPIDGIGKYIHNAVTPEEQILLLQKQLYSVKRSIDILKIHCTEKGQLMPELIKLPNRICMCKDFIAKNIEAFIPLYQESVADIIRAGCVLSREHLNFCEYPPEAFSEDGLNLKNFPVKMCVPIESDEINIPAGAVLFSEQYAVRVSHRGAYEDLYLAYEAIYKFMEEHNLVQDGNPQEIYYDSINTAFAKDQYLTQVVIPVCINIG